MKLKAWAWRILGLTASIELFRISTKNGLDFHVFWTAAESLWRGTSPYDLVLPVSGMVIKYPPWTLPFFLPFLAFPFHWARNLWAMLSLASIYYIFRWLQKTGMKEWRLYLAALLFWWLWAAHLSAGQVFLPIMVACLFSIETKQASPVRNAIMIWAVSSKIFLTATLLGVWKQFTKKESVIWTIGIFTFSHVVLFLLYPKSIYQLYVEWIHAATSSAAGLGVAVYRGQMNHGFTAGILRHTSLNPENNLHDIWIWFLLTVFLGFLWNRFSRKCTDKEKWAGWIALGAVVHPLAWHHSFTLAFPLCALSFDRAVESKKVKYIVMSLIGISFIALLIPQTVGLTLVTPLELMSIKSWGVCLVAATLCLIRK